MPSLDKLCVGVLLAVSILGCRGASRGEPSFTSGALSSASESTGAFGEGETASGDDEVPDRLTTGYTERLDVPDAALPGCQKIDFLFVIDDSGSMADEQQRLIEGFPGFFAAISEAIEQYDFHAMVVTTTQLPTIEVTCEDEIGAGRVRAGDGSDCGLAEGGPRYVTADLEDAQSVLACIANVGLMGGGSERPMWAMAQAATAHTQPGGCNEGFVRDDAILVVTVITDEEDDAGSDSPGHPQLWRKVMVAAKNGDDDALVVLALVGDSDLPRGVCDPQVGGGGLGAEPALRIRQFTESFPFGTWASVCQDDYTDFFTEAVDGIGVACQEFVPPG